MVQHVVAVRYRGCARNCAYGVPRTQAGGSCCASHHRVPHINSESHSPGPALQAAQVVAPLAPEHGMAIVLLLGNFMRKYCKL